MLLRSFLAVLLVAVIGLAALWAAGRGWLAEPWGKGEPVDATIPATISAERISAQHTSALALGVVEPKQILFGDLHVHTTYSADAFQMALPMSNGDGARPVSDACDFARFCSSLDFWSINDHAITLTPERWSETVDAIQQCNAVSGDAPPDTVAYLGWEWTQIGTTPDNHYGHKNVIFRDLEDDRIPTRPIAASPPGGNLGGGLPPTLGLGALALGNWNSGGPEIARYFQDTLAPPVCPTGIPVRDLPTDCRERAATPQALFRKLDDWGHESLVIPHGTTWGMYTPAGSAWDKQLTDEQHDPERQRLVEVYSGHGNSEEYRSFREVVLNADGTRSCPEPTSSYRPSCWRAGELVLERCLSQGDTAEECEVHVRRARQHYVDADRNGGRHTVPGSTVADWRDSGQCTDCFLPSFNYRPRSSVQYMLALRAFGTKNSTFRLGFLASSDNHSARPGTGYKEYGRVDMTEARFGTFVNTILGRAPEPEPTARSEPFDAQTTLPVFAIWEQERAASFFLTGGLTAVHSRGRDRSAIWQSLERREVYGTSGPRILLWFDLLNPPDSKERVPMGSATRLGEAPKFEVRAIGSFEPEAGCDDHALDALGPERLARLCGGECYRPSDHRRPITRVEVVRIRPQTTPDEDVDALIEDPWKVLSCPPDPAGCRVAFEDEEFTAGARDALYYVRAIEAESEAVGADPQGCERDEAGRCIRTQPCWDKPYSDDCLAPVEERAWSSPIFVDFAGL